MVHRPDDAADRVEDDVQEDDRQRHLFAHNPEQHEHVGDHHGREQLQEVLDPEVDDPEAPELGGREVVAGAGDQADGVEGRDRAGRQEEQPRHVANGLASEALAQDPPQHVDPEDEPDHEQHLPQARQVEVLEALQPEPVRRGVLEHAVDPEVGADQASRTRRPRAPRAARRPSSPGVSARAWRSSAQGRSRPRRTTSRPRKSRAARARCASGCRAGSGPGRCRRSRRGPRGSAGRRRRPSSGSGTAPPSRRRTTRSPAAPVSARRRRGRGTTASPARAPASRAGRPTGRTRQTAGRSPASSAISEAADQTITFAVGSFSTRGSGGQLFVYV